MKKILAAVDRSPRAEAVIRAAISEAAATGDAKIDLFHTVMIPPDIPSNLWGMDSGRIYEILAKGAREDLAELAKPIPPGLRGEIVVGVGVAWGEICAAAKERDVDLVVIGAHGYGLLERTLGTTAAKVANHLDRTVLIVRSL